jgi:hypothetical protein
MPSDWYKHLCEIHGPDGIAVGSVPQMDHHTYWVSSPEDPEPTAAQHQAFCEGLEEMFEGFGHEKLNHVRDRMDWPSIVGDYFMMWSETLILTPKVFKGRLEVLTDLLSRIQAFLQQPENRRWRVGYFAGADSLVVFPDKIVIREAILPLRDAASPLKSWLADAILHSF